MIELGLSRIAQLIKPNPIKWKAIHIAGTNGKGSTAAYLSQLLHQYGVSVGRFTSPHVIDRWDCITLKERIVREERFKSFETSVKNSNAGRKLEATEFELLTATAFDLFNESDISVGVVECGLGGALDATNVLEPSEVIVSVITKIGLDHQNLLGSTLTEIAKQKAGIMKLEVPVVIDGSNEPEVLEILRQHAKEAGAPVIEIQTNQYGVDWESLGLQKTVEKANLQLTPHQARNFALAWKAFKLTEARLPPPERFMHFHRIGTDPMAKKMPQPTKRQPDVVSVFRYVEKFFRGRLQRVSIRSLTGRKKNVLLDGAHNTQSAEALGDYVDKNLRLGDRPVTWVIGMSKGKDVESILTPLIRYGDNLVSCTFGAVDGMPWVEPEDAVKIRAVADNMMRPFDVSAQNENEPKKRDGFMKAYDRPWGLWSALGKASAMAGKNGPLVIAGSLYLVSDVLRMLRDPPRSLGKADRDEWAERWKTQLDRRKEGNFD